MQLAPLRRHAHLKRLLPVSLTLVVAAVVQLVGNLGGGGPRALAGEGPASGERRVGVWLTNSPSPLYYDPARIDAAV